MSSRKKDLYSAIFFLAFAILLYALSFSITMSKADALGPQFFPRLVSYAIAGMAVIQIVRCVHTRDPGEQDSGKLRINLPLLGTIGILVGYFLFLKQVGFIILTAVYLFLQMILLLPPGSIKNKKMVIVAGLVSALTPVCIYYLFYYAFSIFLPPGILK